MRKISLDSFIQARVSFGKDLFVTRKDLYCDYVAWRAERGKSGCSVEAFKAAIHEQLPRFGHAFTCEERDGERGFAGVGLDVQVGPAHA